MRVLNADYRDCVQLNRLGKVEKKFIIIISVIPFLQGINKFFFKQKLPGEFNALF